MKDILSSNTSDRLEILRFPLIVLVIFIHSYNPITLLDESFRNNLIYSIHEFSLPLSIQFFISNVFGVLAVPVFYFISGFLLLFNVEFNVNVYVSKIQSRFWSLFVPFLIFNGLTSASLLALQMTGWADSILNPSNRRLYDYTVAEGLAFTFGIDRLRPILYQFWFIRDLIILVFCSPILVILLKKLPKTALTLIGGAWLLNFNPLLYPNIEAVFFFSLGLWAAVHKRSPFLFDEFATAVVVVYGLYLFMSLPLAATAVSSYSSKAGIFLGFATALTLTKPLSKRPLGAYLISLAPYSFFIFALHEPLLTILRKIWLRLWGPSDLSQLFGYFLIPAVIIIALILLYKVLEKHAEFLLRVVAGRRRNR